MGNKSSQIEEPSEPVKNQQKQQNQQNQQNIPTKIENKQLSSVDPQEIDNIIFTKILKLSIKILNRYKESFLNPDFCNNIDIIHKDPILTSITMASLNRINSKLNEETINNSKEFNLVLKYNPQKEVKFIADMFKTELNKYFFKKNVETPDLEKLDIEAGFPKLIINSPYIDNEYVNQVLNSMNRYKMHGGANLKAYEEELKRQIYNKPKSESKVPSNIKNTTITTKSNNFQYKINDSNNSITGPNNFSKLNSARREFENKENIAEKNGENAEKNREKNAERNTEKNGERNTEKNGERNTEGNGEKNKEFTKEIPKKYNQQNRREKNNNREDTQKKRKDNNEEREEREERRERRDNDSRYTHKCSEEDEHCYLTKMDICNEIKKHFYLRKNIIESIITSIPLKTSSGYIGSFCYKRYNSLNDCKICLPANYTELQNLPLDEKISNLMLFINNIDKAGCAEHSGFYKILSDKEKKALFLNNNEFNKYYIKYTVVLKEKYMSYISELYSILTVLDENDSINNATLNKLSDKVKEIIDCMYYLCQYYYLSAIIALLRADLNIETNNQKEKEQSELSFLQKITK